MEKKIETYLPLYIGCDVDTSITGDYIHPYGFTKIDKIDIDSIHKILWALNKKDRDVKGGWSDSDHIYCKPILRRLSSMTEEEAKKTVLMRSMMLPFDKIVIDESNELRIMWHFDNVKNIPRYVRYDELNPKQFVYLLSIGMDLFGLIDSNLAIDRDTL